MTDKNEQLLKYIFWGYSVEKIKQEMGLSSKQFLLRIKQLMLDGYVFDRQFFMNGTCVYQLKRDIHEKSFVEIYSSKTTDEFLVISDTHFGSVKENQEYIHQVYQYAKEKEIHIIFHLGDLIDGIYTIKGEKNPNMHPKYNTTEKQLKHLFKIYPYDSEILTFVLLGNHDLYSLNYDGIDVKTIIENNRTDLIPIGYGIATILVQDIMFNLIHDLVITKSDRSAVQTIRFVGHSHTNNIILNSERTSIYVPSLSDLLFHEQSMIPSALHVRLTQKKTNHTMEVYTLVFTPTPIVVGKLQLDSVSTTQKQYSKSLK